MTRLLLTAAVLLAIAYVPFGTDAMKMDKSADGPLVTVGSKKFTESINLGEMVRLLAAAGGVEAAHLEELGGTMVVFQALRNGDIDIYADYTGTIAKEIIGPERATSIEAIRDALAEQGVVMSEPLGFSNSYALGMEKERAAELGIAKISDLAKHPELAFGFGHEFMEREDGWQAVRDRYRLPQQSVTGLDHDLAYRQIKMGAIDLMDVYATDAEIAKYNLTLLEDDREHFPRYDAVLLYRDDLPERAPDALESMLRLVGGISREQMMQMNSQVVNDRRTPERVTAEFLSDRFGVESQSSDDTLTQRVWQRTGEHLDLVRKSLIPAILIAIPLGVFAAKYPRIGQGILAVVGTIQTIPSLALLVVLMPVIAWLGASSVGPGSATAVTALLLYSLLPIVRNTHAGLHGIEGEYREAAASLGLPAMFRLVHIELPLASRSILAGIKTAAVLNVGFATLGALIGAGGYGQTILQGIRLNDTARILEGAIPSAILALVVQAGFELSERFVVPAGLRIKRAS